MRSQGERDAFQLRVAMTFSERAHPRFVQALRSLEPRARSRLVRSLVEKALALSPELEGETRTVPARSAADLRMTGDQAPRRGIESPLAKLGSPDSLAGAEEMGA
jgi:hypothetical protein